jgi:ParB family chromosome partitioning protein
MEDKNGSGSVTKSAFDAKRGGGYFLFDPDELLLQSDKEHPLYDPRIDLPLSEALVLSIDKDGILQPIRVKKDDDGKPLVVIGRQRVKAAREVKKRRKSRKDPEPVLVPALVTKGSDENLLGYSVTENELRKNDSVIQKARKAQRLSNLGMTNKDISVSMGVSEHAIMDWLVLVNLDGSVQKAVDQGKLSASAAKKFKDLGKEQQKELLEQLTEEGDGPVLIVEGDGKDTGKGKTKKKKKPTAKDVEKKTKGRTAPSRSEIQKRSRDRAYSDDYRDGLLWVLTGDE